MPSDDCDLARQLVKDPQIFEAFGLTEERVEAEPKDAIVANIERTLLSLGRLVSFVGRECPVEIGGETKNIDLLFFRHPPSSLFGVGGDDDQIRASRPWAVERLHGHGGTVL